MLVFVPLVKMGLQSGEFSHSFGLLVFNQGNSVNPKTGKHLVKTLVSVSTFLDTISIIYIGCPKQVIKLYDYYDLLASNVMITIT